MITFCLAILTTLSLVTAPIAGAASDVAGPVLVSSTVTPKSLNIATGPATVKVTLRLTDQTGASEPVVTLGNDATGQSQGFGAMTLISGTAKDGTWERSMTIPQGSATGPWNVTLYPLSDTLGNDSTGFQTLATLNVTATPALAPAPTPTVSGTTKVGRTLTAVPGTWSPAPVTLSYQWYRSGVAITAATMSTYKLTATDSGKTITVRVTGRRSGYTTASRTSAPTAAITAGTLTAPTPTISGTTKVGCTLTAALGTWAPSPVTLSYQ
ncbi:hypothetical protein [Pseudarthrobacter sp. S9]|uniref:hypothetical protein n=1 Tax=Pseudarthrobacter sp. S9 TaxID=3418421 RepID=UPI003D0381BB